MTRAASAHRQFHRQFVKGAPTVRSRKALFKSIFAIIVACTCGLIAHPAAAATCMAGAAKAVPQVVEKSRGKAFTILVDDSEVVSYSQLGFRIISCPEDLNSQAGQRRERDAVCEMAYSVAPELQRRTGEALGVHPGILCQSAERVAGPWNGEKIGWKDGQPPWLSSK